MCGIFGLIVPRSTGYDGVFVREAIDTLARHSESRGKDSSGLVFRNEADRDFRVLKGPVPLRYLLETDTVSLELQRALSVLNGVSHDESASFAMMGHSRLVTNGTQIEDVNNQPVVKDGVIGIHNGIIVNDAELWSEHPEIQRAYEIDTEVMLALVRSHLRKGRSLEAAISAAIAETVGTVAAGFFVDDHDEFAVATNNGSLYVLTNDRKLFVFASEGYFLTDLAERLGLEDEGCRVRQVAAGTGLVLDLHDFALRPFDLDGGALSSGSSRGNGHLPYEISITALTDGNPQRELLLDPAHLAALPQAATEEKLLEYNIDRIRALTRCSKCILPETFPYIDFNADGVCNYCRNYRLKNQPKPIDELEELVAPYRSADGSPDCIIPFSGGRDSTLTLHIIKKKLRLNPITFTYDWGMVTDLARRNIARVCGRLGVENILVSADISRKRENIRKNVAAWLAKPHLGMVPLFMAGDKYFFSYCDKVKKQTGIKLNIWGINPLENTDFKVGFHGVPPDFDKKRIYSLSAQRQARLFWNMAKQLVANPRYLNGSVWDTLGSFVARSIVPHRDYHHMFDYYRWDEDEINRLVREEYEWEMAIDTDTTWRIGDGTAPFYNYIYFTVAGFSEYETFRSNQIREGEMSRHEALALTEKENRPRYPSLKWYLDIIALDFEPVIRRINEIPKLYG